jgi:putative restriction endonuclease
LAEQAQRHGEVRPRRLLAFDGIRVPLIGPKGIFKPAILPDMP